MTLKYRFKNVKSIQSNTMTLTSLLSIFGAVFLVFAFVFAVPEITKRFLDWIERVYNNTPKY